MLHIKRSQYSLPPVQTAIRRRRRSCRFPRIADVFARRATNNQITGKIGDVRMPTINKVRVSGSGHIVRYGSGSGGYVMALVGRSGRSPRIDTQLFQQQWHNLRPVQRTNVTKRLTSACTGYILNRGVKQHVFKARLHWSRHSRGCRRNRLSNCNCWKVTI